MTDSLESYTLMCAIIAIIILIVVAWEKSKSSLSQSCFRTREHPAKNSFLGLCVAEILALLVLAVGALIKDDHEACVSFGALQHYTFQAVLIWLSLFNTDLYLQCVYATRSDRGTAASRAMYRKRNSVLFHGVAWGVPSITVLSQLLQAKPEVCFDGNMYGGHGFCWITDDFAFWIPYLTISILFTVMGLWFTMHWFIVVSVAKDSPQNTAKLMMRISRDLRGASLSFFFGAIAYISGSFISANNPSSTSYMQIIFCVALLLHVVFLAVWFVVVPAIFDIKPTWGNVAGPQYPVSPDGSITSQMSLGSVPSVGNGGLRPMLVPHNMMREHSPSSLQEDPQIQYERRVRKQFAESWLIDPGPLAFFAKSLRASSPKGSVNPEKLASVWQSCFPDRKDETEAFVEQAFLALDIKKAKLIDHNQLCLFLAIFPPQNLNDRLENAFVLFDKNEDSILSQEELRNMLEKITDLMNGSSAAKSLQNQNIVERMMTEMEPVMQQTSEGGELQSIAKSAFINLKHNFKSQLVQTVSMTL